MKICWDNLEKLEYRPDRNQWQDKTHQATFYIYQDSCQKCGEPFLSQEENPGKFCCRSCRNSKFFKGRKHSEEHKRKISEWAKKRLENPENNPNWKGGISCDPYCDVWLDKDFKESIKERDGYQCLNPVCSRESKNLNIHHINYNKKDCRPNNLITLCVSCNSKANKDREWHEAWYSAIINNRYKRR